MGDFRRDEAISLKGSRPEVCDSLSFGVVVVGGKPKLREGGAG